MSSNTTNTTKGLTAIEREIASNCEIVKTAIKRKNESLLFDGMNPLIDLLTKQTRAGERAGAKTASMCQILSHIAFHAAAANMGDAIRGQCSMGDVRKGIKAGPWSTKKGKMLETLNLFAYFRANPDFSIASKKSDGWVTTSGDLFPHAAIVAADLLAAPVGLPGTVPAYSTLCKLHKAQVKLDKAATAVQAALVEARQADDLACMVEGIVALKAAGTLPETMTVDDIPMLPRADQNAIFDAGETSLDQRKKDHDLADRENDARFYVVQVAARLSDGTLNLADVKPITDAITKIQTGAIRKTA